MTVQDDPIMENCNLVKTLYRQGDMSYQGRDGLILADAYVCDRSEDLELA